MAAKTSKPKPAAKASAPQPSAQELPVLQDDGVDDFEADYPEEYPDFYTTDLGTFIAENTQTKILEKREDTRGRLAIIYTLATFGIFILGFAVSVLDAMWRKVSIIDNLATLLPLISGIFLGSLGFVLGYYFRQVEDENDSTGDSLK